jgi:hypothetical protein
MCGRRRSHAFPTEVSLGHGHGKSARGTEILPDSLSVHPALRVAYLHRGELQLHVIHLEWT